MAAWPVQDLSALSPISPKAVANFQLLEELSVFDLCEKSVNGVNGGHNRDRSRSRSCDRPRPGSMDSSDAPDHHHHRRRGFVDSKDGKEHHRQRRDSLDGVDAKDGKEHHRHSHSKKDKKKEKRERRESFDKVAHMWEIPAST
jgi:hypothetical protein